MALKHTNNEVAEVLLQNENLQTQRYIVAHGSNMKTYKNNCNGTKYGLSELSNDKTYLETELPARKRLKPETELFNTTEYLNKTCKAVVNDDESTNFVNEEKYSSEISYILSSKQGFEKNPPRKELLRSELNAEINTQSELSALKSGTYNSVSQSNILANQLKWDSNELTRCNFEKKSENHDFEPNSENDLCENIDNDKISNGETETGFDDEVNKCCKLLNLDVPRMAVVSRAKIANDNFGNKIIQNSEIHKCEISNHNNKSLDTLYPQSTKLVASLKTMSNDINLGTICLGKKLNMQDEFLNKKEKNCEDNIEFKDESNSVLYTIETSNSYLATCNKNCLNFNDKFFQNEINVGVEGNSIKSEFKNNDKNNSTLKINNILNFNSTSIREPNIFISEMIQNHDSKIKTEHLNLTIEATLNSDTLKLKGTTQNISQDHLNDNKDEIDVSSAVDDSGDILSLYDASDIDLDETKEEISKTNLSESAPAILEGTSKINVTVLHANPDHDNKSCTYTGNEVKKEGNFILNEKIDPVDLNHPRDGISNNDCSENKNYFDIKVDESFVSEYEISLLAEDTDSILSEESLDSEYEISLLAEDTESILSEESLDSEYEISLLDDINDEENKNDLHEIKSDSNVGSNYLPNGDEKDEKITAIPEGRIKEQENEQTTDNVNLSEKETDKVISPNKIYSKSISERNTASFTEEKIPSDCQKNKVADKTASDAKISARKEEMQTFSKIKSSEYTNDKTKQDFRASTGGKIILKLEKPTTLRYEKTDDIKKEPLENTNDSHFLLKLEINNESRTPNKGILNSNEFNNSEEKAVIVNTNKYLADNACTNTATIAKFVKTELDVPDIGELKQNINYEFQPSNKVVFNSKMNEIKKSEERILIANTNKQLTESTVTDKAIGEKTVKTGLGVSARSESKQDVKDIIPDYYEEEKEDLINPGWNKIKELSTDEERYRQVRDCWKSKNIPNPFKNLSYYSYRKRKINCGEDNTRQARQHKRHASSNLNDKNAKRSRSCTYIFDDRIKSIKKENEMKTKTLQDKMSDEVSRLNELHQQKEMGIQNFYGYNFDPRRQYELNSLRRDYQLRVSSVTAEYEQKVNDCYDQCTSEINKLKNNRNEVLQFYSFYKGLNINEYKDPTILTNAQMQELEEIENIYNQMDLHYR